MTSNTQTFSPDEARAFALQACRDCGAGPATSRSLAEATVSAEIAGRPEVGFRHLIDYLQGFLEGRIAKDPTPSISSPLPTLIHSDAGLGIAQLGFDLTHDRLADTCRTYGTAMFVQKNSYTAGELGYYVRRLALDGFVSIAAANGPPLMAAMPNTKPVYCTNPLAFGAPGGVSPLVIDQALSATAFVNVVKAAEAGASLPEGWAIDADGEMTTDARAALGGALLPFGGYKGANIALMVEVLAAGVAGASWSADAGNFRSGSESPKAGLTILVVTPSAIDPNFEERLTDHLTRLRRVGVHVPGMQPAREHISVENVVVDRIAELASSSLVTSRSRTRPRPQARDRLS